MKKVSINLLTNVILLLAGIILIVFHGVPEYRCVGLVSWEPCSCLPAVAYLVMVAVRHADARTSTDYMGVLPAVGGLCFGLVMIIKAHLFDEILQLLIGMLLIVLGLFHVIYLLLSRNSLKVKGWYYLWPVAGDLVRHPVACVAGPAQQRADRGAGHGHLLAAVQLHQPAGVSGRAPRASSAIPTCR